MIVNKEIKGVRKSFVMSETTRENNNIEIAKEEANLLQTIHLVNNKKNRLLNIGYIVSHNLKNQIGNLSSLVQMKDSGIIDKEEFFSYVSSISNELKETINNLGELITIQDTSNIVKEDLKLNEYLNKTFHVLFDELNTNKIQINNNVSNDFMISFNKSYLESVLLNLTSNAIKYSNRNSLPFIEYSTEISGNYKVLIVKDNGIGIDIEKHKEDLFGLYKTFHPNTNSIGIGLYITKNQIDEMDGKIEVESKLNEGTTFKIYFR